MIGFASLHFGTGVDPEPAVFMSLQESWRFIGNGVFALEIDTLCSKCLSLWRVHELDSTYEVYRANTTLITVAPVSWY